MSWIKDLEAWWKKVWSEFNRTEPQPQQDQENEEPAVSASQSSAVPAWDKCTLASCWNGKNASQRMMNMLSLGMPEATFDAYLAWMKARGCNTAHVFVSNLADGPHAAPGCSIYGTGKTWDWTVDAAVVSHFKARIAKIRKAGLAYVPWLFADDSSLYAKAAKANFPKYLADLKAQGILAAASMVVLGLELDEYFSAADVQRLAAAARAVFKGKIGTHQGTGGYAYAKFADVCFYQVKPGTAKAKITAEAKRIRAATGKPLNFFEMERSPDRDRCQAAFAGGAYAVGNW